MGCKLPGSSVHGILQARILERVAISYSRESSQPRDQTMSLASPALEADSLQLSHLIGDMLCLVSQLRLTLFNPMDCTASSFSVHRDSSGKNTGMSCHVLLQGIFPTQGRNPELPHCRWILYWLSHQGINFIFLHVEIQFSNTICWKSYLIFIEWA